jgi:hypothetical protein
MIDVTSFNFLTKNKNTQIFFASLRDINIELDKKTKSITNLKTIVSIEYHDFLNVFSKIKVDELSSHRKYDHTIKLKNSASNQAFLYDMSEEELILVKKYLKKNLEKEFIKVSSASFTSSVLFAKKSEEELRFCVDYRKLNAIIKKNRYSLSLIFELMTRLFKAKYMIKIDIRHAFNRIKMTTEDDEDLIIFRTRFESYKSLILSFELTNEFVTFQNFMNDILMKFLNEFVIAYLDDILIYSNNMKEHLEHVRKIL